MSFVKNKGITDEVNKKKCNQIKLKDTKNIEKPGQESVIYL